MKKFYYLAFAFVAALVMTGCSDDSSIAESGSGSSVAAIDGYIGMTINLPTSTGSTRAGAVTGFVDGTADEYAVKDATLFLFAGTDESTATLAGISEVSSPDAFTMSDNDQITSKGTVAFKVNGLTEDTKYYPIVVLNSNGQISTSSLTVGESTIDALNNVKIATSAAELTADGFFMSNSPYSNHGGGDNDPHAGQSGVTEFTLTTAPEVTLSQVYTTEKEALNYPATSIYVERAVGKVTLGTGNADGTLSTIKDDNVASVKLEGWFLDNTNNYTYPVRNVTSLDNGIWGYISDYVDEDLYMFRFVDDEPIETGVYRTHFGKDPNYEDADNFTGAYTTTTEVTNDDFLPVSTDTDITDNPQYCTENTFDVPHMTEPNTTRAVIKTTLAVNDTEGKSPASGTSFYIVNNNENLLYTDVADLQAYMKLAVASELNKNWSTYISDDMPEGGVKDTFVDEVALKTMTTGGTDSVTVITIDNVTWAEGGNAALIAAINKAYTISYYHEGVVYYRVLIKHFGDDETPWSALYPEVAADPSYGVNDNPETAEMYFLGRYGILRNTWYSISVDNLVKIGDPKIPYIPDIPDDGADEYLGVTINILSWAVRKQSATLE